MERRRSCGKVKERRGSSGKVKLLLLCGKEGGAVAR
jgi:hypothetical protein